MKSEEIALIQVLQTTENLLEEVYKLCGDLFPEAKEDFFLMAGEERGHSLVFENVLEHAREHPDQWRVGKVDEMSIRHLHQRIRTLIDEVRSGKTNIRSTITNALSIEQSLGEQCLDRTLQCEDPEQTKGLRLVAEGFTDHFKRLLALQDRLNPTPNRLTF